MAVTALPWKEILKGATLAVSLARDLMKREPARAKAAGDTPSDPRAQLAALGQRVEALEISDEQQAKVVKMLAEEVQGLARRAMVGYWVGMAGLVVGIVAFVVALVR